MRRKQKLEIVLTDILEHVSSPLGVDQELSTCELKGDTVVFHLVTRTQCYIVQLHKTFTNYKIDFELTLDSVAEREVFWYYTVDGSRKVQL